MHRNFIFLIFFSLFLLSCTKERIQIVEHDRAKQELSERIAQLEEGPAKDLKIAKLIQKNHASALSHINRKTLSLEGALKGHTKLYSFKGKYRVLVIPVQFSDTKFSDPDFFEKGVKGASQAQNYLFGNGPATMATYYKHASLGKFDLDGEVTGIVTVDGTLADYGEAVENKNDKNARGLVVDALALLKERQQDTDWWHKFDSWDLSDYDGDTNYHEPDGFIDSVVLIYAGKSQASCQASFDVAGKKPISAEVPPGPRHDQAVECFNRIWPHRWAISLSSDDPRYAKLGPLVEGQQRTSMNGLKISDGLFALDYNMQSEYSDRSTFIHEFGHSLSLPDVYSDGKGNSTGQWTVMSSNAGQQAQELDAFSRLSLGWLGPKVIQYGEKTSAYLGATNFVSEAQRESPLDYHGPKTNAKGESLLSTVPEFAEDVYRSIVVLTKPSTEILDIVDFPEYVGNRAAYSSTFDGESRSYKVKFVVPEKNPILSFDTIYHIETETNFDGNDSIIKVTTDFDIGAIVINDEVQEDIRSVSGDDNGDSLAEINPNCDAARVLALRLKKIDGLISDPEKNEFAKKTKICQKPIWVNKKIDLSKFAGKEIVFEVRLTTDAGYTEFGIVLDNITLGAKKIDFEENEKTDEFVALIDGKEEKVYNRFYLMEYRVPQEKYEFNDSLLSLNMDNNISTGLQSMFLREGDSLAERFRMITYDYRPGVLVWYFNAKLKDDNDAVKNAGKGFLLVLNSKVQELKLPGILGDPSLFDENGHYKNPDKHPEMKNFLAMMRNTFTCFSNIEYSTYINGKAPTCKDGFEDYMQSLTYEGKKLLYSRERRNELLPINREGSVGINRPYRNIPKVRTGLSTFSPEGSADFSPFKVFKEEGGQMILDPELTALTAKYKAVSSFSDRNNELSKFKRFQGDSVVVEKQGLNFKVGKPGRRALGGYTNRELGDENNQFFRRPRAKIYIDWD